MLRRFLRDVRGNYAMITAIAMVPIMGGLALAVDYSEMNRQRQATLNALDAACVATGRRIVQGGTDEQIRAYADDFFVANLGPVEPDKTTLTLTLPSSETGGGTLRCDAELTFNPYFYPAFVALLDEGRKNEARQIKFGAHSEVRLKNTLEVALVLDNSGSMDLQGKGSGKKRIELLKAAAKQLIDTISAQAAQMKQVDKPVQFALVPFAASVNIGPDNADKSWMDQDGISPIHHENFDWSTFTDKNKEVKNVGGAFYKVGAGWGDEENEKVTRFTLYEELLRVTDVRTVTERVKVCKKYKKNGDCKKYGWVEKNQTMTEYGPFAKWEGCVEARPHPHNTTDAAAATSTPATLFVPMFGPDETDATDPWTRRANNNWWLDHHQGNGEADGLAAKVQRYMPKYFIPAALKNGSPVPAMGLNQGPNASCTTKPITPLVDVSSNAGVTKIKDAIDEMEPLGATNVPEGLAWGWRALSGHAPFTEGRPDSESGNDKIVIVLTDGENTYYTPQSLGFHDLAGNKSTYSSYGYLKPYDSEYDDGRLFLGTSTKISKTDFSNGNYGAALNEQMLSACANAKAAGVVIMAVALDLDSANAAQKKQIESLTECASESRFRKDEKLFWNTTGGNLADTFKKIADELSNLRIVG